MHEITTPSTVHHIFENQFYIGVTVRIKRISDQLNVTKFGQSYYWNIQKLSILNNGTLSLQDSI